MRRPFRPLRPRLVQVALLLGLVALAVTVASPRAQSRTKDPHNSACATCHAGVPTPDAPAVARDISQLCQKCHPRPASNSHPVGMVPSMKVPDDLHLDWRGKMTCATCHDVHQQGTSGRARYPVLLRRPQPGWNFCVACHRNIGAPGAKILHGLAAASAREPARMIRAGADSGPLDAISRDCLRCHDGAATTDKATAMQAGVFDHGDDIGVIHPIGVDYTIATLRNRSLVPVTQLSSSIRLVNGQVGCGSCHESLASSRNQLIMSNAGSALCLQCHRM